MVVSFIHSQSCILKYTLNMKRFSDENEFCVKNRTTYKYSVISEFVRSVRNDIYFSRLQEKIVPNFKLSKIKYYSFSPPKHILC